VGLDCVGQATCLAHSPTLARILDHPSGQHLWIRWIFCIRGRSGLVDLPCLRCVVFCLGRIFFSHFTVQNSVRVDLGIQESLGDVSGYLKLCPWTILCRSISLNYSINNHSSTARQAVQYCPNEQPRRAGRPMDYISICWSAATAGQRLSRCVFLWRRLCAARK